MVNKKMRHLLAGSLLAYVFYRYPTQGSMQLMINCVFVSQQVVEEKFTESEIQDFVKAVSDIDALTVMMMSWEKQCMMRNT